MSILVTNYSAAPVLGTDSPMMDRMWPRPQVPHILAGKTGPCRSRKDIVLVLNWRNGVCRRERGNPLEGITVPPREGKGPQRGRH